MIDTSPKQGLKVLWATDGSESAIAAVPLLKSLVLPVAASVNVVTVAPEPMLSGARPDPVYLRRWSAAERRAAKEDALSVAAGDARRLGSLDIPVETDALFGHPIQQILRYSKSHGMDLIVVGAKGQSSLEMMFLGSVAQGVLQYADRPVLLARPGVSSVETAVVGVDGSRASMRAVKFIDRLALDRDFLLVLVRAVYLLSAGQRGFISRSTDEIEEFNQRARRQAEENLATALSALHELHRPTISEILPGEAGPQLLLASAVHEADLLVVGSGRPSRLKKYLVGTTAEYVARQAAHSVLVVR